MPERPSGRAALPLSCGVALIGVATMFAWLWPEGDGRYAALAPFGFGMWCLVWGLYLLVDRIERR
ncbi:hypothetical protein [Promicromonospora sp. NPDC023805]|uniref:hypothetical protein n=1 Tax=Promicromonospora sp. NPDC023805 TaxID=3154696 RepID=UPI00340A6AEF